MTRDELIAALKAATGPSFVLDGAIDGWRIQEEMAAHGRSSMHLVPRPYTASIDAALTLVPSACDVVQFHHDPSGSGWELGEFTGGEYIKRGEGVTGGLWAIALCIAAIRARGDA